MGAKEITFSHALTHHVNRRSFDPYRHGGRVIAADLAQNPVDQRIDKFLRGTRVQRDQLLQTIGGHFVMNTVGGEAFQIEMNTAGEFAVDNRFATSPMKMTIVVE